MRGTMVRMTEQITPLDVANKVRGIAAERRLTQSDLASALNVSRMAIVRRYNGSVPFTVDDLIRLSRTMNVRVGAFFGEVPSSVPHNSTPASADAGVVSVSGR